MNPIYDDMTGYEREVASFLDELGLKWFYEFPVFVYDKWRPRIRTPDFYIPTLSLYIEVAGSEEFNYEYRERIYKDNGSYVIFLHAYKESSRWKHFLIDQIQQIGESRHNEMMNVLNSLSRRSISD